jgi:hypothetical protein
VFVFLLGQPDTGQGFSARLVAEWQRGLPFMPATTVERFAGILRGSSCSTSSSSARDEPGDDSSTSSGTNVGSASLSSPLLTGSNVYNKSKLTLLFHNVK